MATTKEWKEQDKFYHEDPAVVSTFDRRISRKYYVEHKYFTLYPWIHQLKARGSAIVLDFGCATGTASAALAKHGLMPVSLDASMSMIQTTVQKVQNEGAAARGVLGDAEQMPFKNEVFDGIICMGVLHHLPNILQGVKEQIRTLKKGGTIYISEPCIHKPWISVPYELVVGLMKSILGLFKKHEPKTLERPLDNRTIAEIHDLAKHAGCECQVKYFVYWPNVLGYLPESLGLGMVHLINRFNDESKHGDIVYITIQRKL